ncbi:MAG: glycoside hydrolase family 31 protein [Bacteroidota bacterium]
MAGTQPDESIFEGNYMEKFDDRKDSEFYPNQVINWKRKDWKFYFDSRDTTLEVSVLGDFIIRFRYSVYENMEDDFSYAIPNPTISSNASEIIFSETDDLFIISTVQIKCLIQKSDLRHKIVNNENQTLFENEKGYHWREEKNHGGYIVLSTNKLEKDDQFFALGDKPCRLNLKGKKLQLWGVDHYGYGSDSDPVYKNVPFFIGIRKSKAFGVFFDNTFRSFFDFGKERDNAYSFWAHGGEMNYYFIYGPTASEVTEKYTVLTGKPQLPPMWSLGYHQSKWSYYPETVVRELAETFRSKKIPCDVIHLDIDYMDGYRCFTWDNERFPNPKSMISDLNSDGFKIITIIDPGIKIDKDYWVYKQGLDNQYFCKRSDGPLFRGSVWPGLCYFPDFTNPKVRNWWSSLFEGLIDDGVDGIWNDMNEPAVFEEGTFPLDIRHDYDGHPCSHRKAHNVYGMQMARATTEGQRRFLDNKRPFTITRSAYAGVQRYSSVWTGDNVASWEHLRIANVQCQRLSASGISFAGSDIGGFIDSPDGELYTRWIQLGVFHPFFRTHSSGDHGDKEPWTFGSSYERIIRRYIELRYELLPYIYSTFWKYVTYATPMLKSLFMIDEQDPECMFREDEFMLGEDFLICPITEPGVNGRKMYIPKGSWFNFWTDELVSGRQEIWVDAPLSKIPVFVKRGAVIPIYPKMQYVGEKEIFELTLHIYTCESEVENTIYEDSGDSYDFQNGQYRLMKLFSKGTDKSFELNQVVDGEFEASYPQYRLVFHGIEFKPSDLKVDGEKIDYHYHEKKKTYEAWVNKDFNQLVFS